VAFKASLDSLQLPVVQMCPYFSTVQIPRYSSSSPIQISLLYKLMIPLFCRYDTDPLNFYSYGLETTLSSGWEGRMGVYYIRCDYCYGQPEQIYLEPSEVLVYPEYQTFRAGGQPYTTTGELLTPIYNGFYFFSQIVFWLI
jgi:hypothetical protein